jgi:hypothetical protein
MKSQKGTLYIIGADIQIDTIKQTLNDKALSLLLHLAVVLALTLPFLTWRLRQINNNLLQENKVPGEEVEEPLANLQIHPLI